MIKLSKNGTENLIKQYTNTFFQYFPNKISSGHNRSVKAKKNILYIFILRIIGIITGILLVPLVLGYIDAERYGIWLTMSSILNWSSFIDIGFTNGLRNLLAEAFANDDENLAITYISSTYVVLCVLSMIVILIFFLINPYINWQILLNTEIVPNSELTIITEVVFTFFILKIILKVIGSILLADQRPAINDSFNIIPNILALVVIFILTKTFAGSLFIITLVLSSLPVIVLAFATVYFFLNDYTNLRPRLTHVNLVKTRNLFNLGTKFFFIQLSGIVFFSSINFLIAQVSTQESVVAYNITYKYLFTVNMLFAIILSPIWNGVTEAYTKQDFPWLKRILKKLIKIGYVFIVSLIFMVSISNFVFNIWIGDLLFIPYELRIVIALYLAQHVFLSPYSNFINGMGKLQVLIYILIIQIIVYIPLAIILGNNFGPSGIVLALFLIQLFPTFVLPYQVKLLINQKAFGIWNK